MKLVQLFKEVQEKNLSKQQLEDYHADLSSLFADMHLEMAELEKAEAVYLDESEEKTVAGASRRWNAGEKGQRQIDLKHKIRATEKILSSLRSRLYSVY